MKQTSGLSLIICITYTLKVKALMSSKDIGRCVDSGLKMIVEVASCAQNEQHKTYDFLTQLFCPYSEKYYTLF